MYIDFDMYVCTLIFDMYVCTGMHAKWIAGDDVPHVYDDVWGVWGDYYACKFDCVGFVVWGVCAQYHRSKRDLV